MGEAPKNENVTVDLSPGKDAKPVHPVPPNTDTSPLTIDYTTEVVAGAIQESPALAVTLDKRASEVEDNTEFSVANQPADPPKGERYSAVPGYEILGVLGRGGMGVVYKARQRKLNRVVALKMVLAGAHASPNQLARFLTEAEAVARLQHPNIVQLYEIGDHEGLPYFSLEFVNGDTLAKKLGGKPLSAREAAEMTEKLASAMQSAHEQGIIHRDLKPANILLNSDGVPKITDFGLPTAGVRRRSARKRSPRSG